jgi:phage shock protein A
MSYFSRLTDIVTCSLTEILSKEADPASAVRQIIHEMEEGLAGAQRSVNTATANGERIRREIAEHTPQIQFWTSKAKDELQAGSEGGARLALVRKREIDDLVAGLQQQHKAATATREHLTTTLHALEARLAEARRKRQQLESDEPQGEVGALSATESAAAVNDARAEQIERDLEDLKRELGR